MMKLNCSKQELLLVAIAVIVGVTLRCSRLDRLAVEHFDEGVYASGLWYDQANNGESYPMRHLYAPPLLPECINLVGVVPGLGRVAPFVPSILLGCCTCVLLWWVARTWFGMTAGLFLVFVAAGSDFHILYSRMALTDVPVLFWTCLAVGLGAKGIHHRSVRTMVLAGVSVGIAWWTKYTGWLALAIILSGASFWWVLAGRKELSITTLLKLFAVLVVTAGVVWAPWYVMLEDHGGYSAVAENHRGYFLGFNGWQDRMAQHILYHFRFDSWLGAVFIGLGLLAAAIRRWLDLRAVDTAGDRPSAGLLSRFVATALLLTILSSGIGAMGILVCLGIGGMAGMFLWPMLTALHKRKCHNAEGSAASDTDLQRADSASAASINPMLAACIVVAWFCGMTLMTPMYHPYPRLSLPLLASIWLAAAGGVSWWIESNISVERKEAGTTVSAHRPMLRRAIAGMAAGALVLVFGGAGQLAPPLIWQNRTSLRDASWHIASASIAHAKGTFEPSEAPLHLNEAGMVTPESETPAMDEEGNEVEPISDFAEIQALIVSPFETSQPLADPSSPDCVVYTFGEPAVSGHLRSAGLNTVPIQDLKFPAAAFHGKPLPTFVVLGPYALRTPGLLDEWATAQYRFDHVADFHFEPGDAVLYNLFSPEWVGQHLEAYAQKLELYRLR